MSVAVFQSNLEKILTQPGTIGDLFKTAEEKTGVKRLYLAYGAIGLITIWLAFGYGAQLLANLIGFVYPAYCSMKALETKLIAQDDRKWLTYWVVFAVFSVAEFFTDILVGWVPFYWLVKCLFLLWCMAPIQSNGSEIIYNRIVRPYFLKNQSAIDQVMDKVTSKAGEVLKAAEQMKKD